MHMQNAAGRPVFTRAAALVPTHQRVLAAACVALALCAVQSADAQPVAAGAPLPAATSRPTAASAEAQRIFDAHWSSIPEYFPEAATYRGEKRFGDRLTDASPQAEQRWYAHLAALKAAVDRLPLGELTRQERISVRVLQTQLAASLQLRGFEGLRSMTVNVSPWPFQNSFLGLLNASPVATERDVEQMLARIAAYPRRVAQEIASMRRGMALGWVPPRIVLEGVLRQLDAQLAQRGDSSPYAAPFKRLSGIAEPRRSELRAAGAAAVDAHVFVAIAQLRDFVAGDFMAAAPERVGLAQYPNGADAYRALVRIQTTTDLSPDAIHAIGLEQVAKAHRGMQSVMAEVGFSGDLQAFMKYANGPAGAYKKSPAEVLVAYRDILKRIDPELPRLFAVMPRAPYGVRSLPAYLGPGAAETYSAPALDGSRPGWFNANTVGYAVRPSWYFESIALHEGVPGHHMQHARAIELEGMPAFRRVASFNAFNEGWALYAETLGGELGLYKDPYSRFGFEVNQAWRAARLVVDTGLHAKGWTRQQAIDYLQSATGMDRVRVESEVDRYISDPGQALSYMVGQLKFIELRERAQRALGARFDIRRFHSAVLDNGMLPLDVLDSVIDEWISEQLKAA
jgi:uncharacterized protein (DUF885 family)